MHPLQSAPRNFGDLRAHCKLEGYPSPLIPPYSNEQIDTPVQLHDNNVVRCQILPYPADISRNGAVPASDGPISDDTFTIIKCSGDSKNLVGVLKIV